MSRPIRVVAKLSPISIGVAIGVAEGLYIMLFAWLAALGGVGAPIVQQASNILYGYNSTFLGGLLGGLWGFVDGFVFGIVSGLIYNACLSWMSAKNHVSRSSGDEPMPRRSIKRKRATR